ncbi:ABC transporter permease [Mesomycoplasma neurolyticum]|uniref:Uncharacterized ABC transporter permease MG468 homolog n=1 Tax=Mesomycoplasma neurolyticum TaxID=2120 RepID=A0A449A5M2_9BACT|nr:ABC transporter permease [Mesomycoplasma neurolyticum]VEU59453.1 Uncharacterized ABC transporter permease MG468 homolog [Mesomycoplasma neurolyticum]
MFKLFKEVFKSLSKNKITVFCLSILIFLTTVVFSTLFSVKESFSRSIKNYNNVSVLHDATVDLDINLLQENSPNFYKLEDKIQIYDKNSKESNEEKLIKSYSEEYFLKNAENFETLSLKYPDKEFIKLSDLGVADENKDYYISSYEFNLLFENRNFKDYNFLNFDFQNINNAFFQAGSANKLLVLYEKPDFSKKVEQYSTLEKNSDIKLDRKYTFGEIVNIIDKGGVNTSLIGGYTDGRIKSINKMSINLNTREASFDAEKNIEWKNQGVLKELTEDETNKYLQLEKQNDGTYILSYGKDSLLFNWNDIGYWDSKSFLNEAARVIKPEGEIKTRVLKYLGDDATSLKIPKYFYFKPNLIYTIPKKWIQKITKSIKYIKYNYVLPDLNSLASEYKNIVEYLKFLKTHKPDEFKKFENFYYWKKEVTTIINGEKKYSEFNISKNDLLKQIYSIDDKDKVTTIASIENLGNENNIDLISDFDLSQLSNDKIAKQKYQQIFIQTARNSDEIVYSYLTETQKNNASKFVDKIGRRKFRTVNATDSTLNNKEIVYQFINSGISKDQFNISQKNEVGKLFYENNINSQNSRLFIEKSLNTEIAKDQIPVYFIPQIIEKIFQGFNTDPEYIDIEVHFISRKILSENGLDYIPTPAEKIILLEKINKLGENNSILEYQYAIGQNEDKNYLIYRKKFNTDDWEIFNYENKQYLNKIELSEFLQKNNFTLNAKIGQNGWFKQSLESKDIYFIPFVYRVPVSTAFDEIKKEKKADLLFNTLFAALKNSELVEFNFISEENLKILLDSLHLAFIKTEFYKFLTDSSSDIPSIRRLLFETFYYATSKYDGNFFENIISDFFKAIKIQLNKFNSVEDQKNYIEEQIQTINEILKIFHINDLNNFLISVDLQTILKTIKDPVAFLDAMKNILLSIDYKDFFKKMHTWDLTKENKFKEENGNKIYYVFSIYDLLIPLLESINFDKFKRAVNSLIDEISFSDLLSTKKVDNEYQGLLLKELSNKNPDKKDILDQVATVLNKLNGNETNDPKQDFNNIASSMKNLIKILDIDVLLKYIKASQEKRYFYDDNRKKHYEETVIKKSDLITSIIISYFKDENSQETFKKNLITLLNASGKTEKTGESKNIVIGTIDVYYSKPVQDDKKITIFDLQAFGALENHNIKTTLEKLNKLLNSLEKAEKEKIVNIQNFLNIKDAQNIKENWNIVPTIKMDDSLKTMLKKAKFYKKILNFYSLSPSKNITFSDKIFNLIFSEKELQGNYGYNEARKEIINFNKNVFEETPDYFIFSSKQYYEFWTKFMLENNYFGEKILGHLNNVISLVTENSPIYDKLSETNFEVINIKTENFKDQLEKQLGPVSSLPLLKSEKEKQIQPIPISLVYPFEISQQIFNDKDTMLKLVKILFVYSNIDKIENLNKKQKEVLKWVSENLQKIYEGEEKDKYQKLFIQKIFNDPNIQKIENLNKKQKKVWEWISQNWKQIFKDEKSISKSAVQIFSYWKIQSIEDLNEHQKKLLNWIYQNRVEFVYELAKLTYLKNELSTKDYSKIVDNMIKVNGKLEDETSSKEGALKEIYNFVNNLKDDEEIEIFNSFYKSNSFVNSLLMLMGFPKYLFSSVDVALLPTALLWFTANADNEVAKDKEGNANLKWIINNRLTDFAKIKKQDEKNFYLTIKERVNSIFNEEELRLQINNSNSTKMSFDLTYLKYLTNNLLTKEEIVNNEIVKKDIRILNISLKNLVNILLNSVTLVVNEEKLVVFYDRSSYVAKVSESFLYANNKEVYTGHIPEKTTDLLDLIENKLDPKYLIDVSGSKFLITGIDSTADYLFPVINEENLQVNTENQALVYLNDYGYDRIRNSFADFQEKDYFLVKLKNKKDLANFNAKMNSFFAKNFSESLNKKVFATHELDYLNPERSLRVSTAFNVIKFISNINLYIVALLSFLVAMSSLFITKRYISTRNKVIGILKAQGYSSFQIAISFLSLPLITSITGTFLGYLTSLGAQSIVKNALSSYWTLPNNNLQFELFLFLGIIFAPLIFLSIIVVFSALFILRAKPIDLLSGIKDINIGTVSQKANLIFRNSGLKTKFVGSLTINSFWKLFSLMISVILASFISIFSISSYKIFDKAIQSTYEHRKYNYKLDLETPTNEGGQYNTFSQSELQNILYSPIGIIEEANQNSSGYFAKGKSININGNDSVGWEKNGDPHAFEPHAISRSSLNIKIDSVVSFSPWELVLNAMPNSQRSRTLQFSRGAISALELSQDIKYDSKKDLEYVGEDSDNPQDYFVYQEEDYNSPYGKFWYNEWNSQKGIYELKEINTSNYRDKYREFLIKGYTKINTPAFKEKIKTPEFKKELMKLLKVKTEQELLNSKHRNVDANEFFVGFHGVLFDETLNEKYSYFNTNYKGRNFNVYGYNSESKFIQIMTSDNINLLKEFEKKEKVKLTKKQQEFYDVSDNTIYPLAVNHVFLHKYKLKLGDLIALDILNTTDRHQLKIHNLKPPKYLFEIQGIINTKINNELVTTKAIVDKLTRMSDNLLDGEEAFNGVLSSDSVPRQTINSVSLYSHSSFSPINNKITTDNSITNGEIFRELFTIKANEPEQLGSLLKSGMSENTIYKIIFYDKIKDLGYEQQNQKIEELKDTISLDYEVLKNLQYAEEKKEFIKQALENFISIYSDKAYTILSTNVNAKEIEVGFVSGISKTISKLTLWIISIFFIVSNIILIMISTMIIAENEKNISIFSILGYNNKEKIKLFFGVYFPLIIIATLISIPILLLTISVFNSFIVGANLIWLSLSLEWWHIIASTSIIIIVFILTSIISWIKLNKIKAIYILKGK